MGNLHISELPNFNPFKHFSTLRIKVVLISFKFANFNIRSTIWSISIDYFGSHQVLFMFPFHIYHFYVCSGQRFKRLDEVSDVRIKMIVTLISTTCPRVIQQRHSLSSPTGKYKAAVRRTSHRQRNTRRRQGEQICICKYSLSCPHWCNAAQEAAPVYQGRTPATFGSLALAKHFKGNVASSSGVTADWGLSDRSLYPLYGRTKIWSCRVHKVRKQNSALKHNFPASFLLETDWWLH